MFYTEWLLKWIIQQQIGWWITRQLSSVTQWAVCWTVLASRPDSSPLGRSRAGRLRQGNNHGQAAVLAICLSFSVCRAGPGLGWAERYSLFDWGSDDQRSTRLPPWMFESDRLVRLSGRLVHSDCRPLLCLVVVTAVSTRCARFWFCVQVLSWLMTDTAVYRSVSI